MQTAPRPARPAQASCHPNGYGLPEPDASVDGGGTHLRARRSLRRGVIGCLPSWCLDPFAGSPEAAFSSESWAGYSLASLPGLFW
ncbi:hypothetical protein GUJ93_ZPchr0006g42700 [Zizania palustris]|uniref:Uncharacterized protein n=1 Tax=Zizania palustris TaxID=103762 RepID=A0A8J5VKN2_ZIZPA|nr:hypothetical protein GUJ93_ZPchr0006g42700 [Zizania palustris]